MEFTKKLNLNNIFIFLFLIVFPFGQIIRIGILQPLDVIVGMGAVYAVLKRFEKPFIFKYFENTLILFVFSWVFGTQIFKQPEVYYGFLYLIRLTAYFYFFLYAHNFARKSVQNKKLLINSLLSVSVVSAIFGWIQFVMIPDIKPFFTWNWDMHLYRLVGAFLDPTFLSLIIVFGILISIVQFLETKRRFLIPIALFLLVSLAFTYSRAGYLALFAGITWIAWNKKLLKKALLFILGFITLLFLLPTSRNHSIELLRSFSAIARVDNYQTTLKLFSKSPIFGVGYDNMCLAYQKYIGPQSFSSHACSGSDSSVLFVLATTGIAGLIVFVYNLGLIANSIKKDSNHLILSASFVAVLTHSIFSNSLFYPWILGWLIILLATSFFLRSEV